MSVRVRSVAVGVTAVLGLGLVAGPAAAQSTAMSAHRAPVGITLSTAGSGTAALLPSPSSLPGIVVAPDKGTPGLPDNSTQAWQIRLAVKAALAAVKATSSKTYYQIVGYVAKGKTAFVSWWNSSVPSWVKGLFGSISAAAIYDALKWLLGF